MSGDAAAHINSQEGVYIELMEVEINVSGPTFPRLDAAIHFQFGLFELGLAGNFDFGAVGFGIENEVTRPLLVKAHITDMNGGVDHWGLQCSGARGCEIRKTADVDARILQLRNAGQVKILPGQMKAKC